MFDHINFPPMPPFKAKWRAVYLEPIVGSGERLTVLIIVKTDESEIKILEALHPTAIENLYGSNSVQLKSLIDMLKKSFEKSEGENVSIFDGIYTSAWNNAASQDLQGIFKQALFRSASLGLLASNSLYGDESETEANESIDKRWTEKIRNIVIESNPDLSSAFNHTLKVGELVTVKCGFHINSYTAKFNVCTSQTVMRMRSSVVDLQLIERYQKSTTSDLLILMPDEKDPRVSAKAHARMKENVYLLGQNVESYKGISVIPIYSEQEGAERILDMAKIA